jgi:hypothetical protein
VQGHRARRWPRKRPVYPYWVENCGIGRSLLFQNIDNSRYRALEFSNPMNNNKNNLNLVFNNILCLTAVVGFGLAIFLNVSDPLDNYFAIYQLFFGVAIFLSLSILSIQLIFRVQIIKKLTFVQDIYKFWLSSFVVGFTVTYLILLNYTNSLSNISVGIILIAFVAYGGYQFLD